MTLHPNLRARDFAAKLRLTAATLGCTSQKELALAFRRNNPGTEFDLGRSYKWMQGRTLPRSPRLFEEWAALLDTGHTADQLLSCSLEEFQRWLTERHGPALALPGTAGPDVAPAAVDATALHGAGLLHGHYACYSHAQSPYFQGRVIRSSLFIGRAPSRGGTPTARYSQTITGGTVVEATGPLRIYGQIPCLELHGHAASVAPVFITLFRPTPPASVLAGMMLSFTVVDPGHQPPYATRFVAVRVPEAAAAGLDASNRYLTAAEWPPSADLADLGLAVHAAPELDDCLLESLGGAHWSGSDRVPAPAYARLTAACDRAWLAAAEDTGRHVPARPAA